MPQFANSWSWTHSKVVKLRQMTGSQQTGTPQCCMRICGAWVHACWQWSQGLYSCDCACKQYASAINITPPSFIKLTWNSIPSPFSDTSKAWNIASCSSIWDWTSGKLFKDQVKYRTELLPLKNHSIMAHLHILAAPYEDDWFTLPNPTCRC